MNCARVCTDRKSTRLNSSHLVISYAVFCLKKKKKKRDDAQATYLTTRCRADASIPHEVYEWSPILSQYLSARFSAVSSSFVFFFFFNDTATTEIYTLSLHDALPI